MGKRGKVDSGVAVDGLGTHQAAVDGVEVEGAMNGVVGEGERYGIIYLAEEYIVVGCVGGNGSVAAQCGVFGPGAVEKGLETGVALQPDEGVGGHKTGGLHIGSPMVARNDTTATIFKSTLQHSIHAVGSQLHHSQRKTPSKGGMRRRIG